MDNGSWGTGDWNRELFEGCLYRSQMLAPSRQGFNHILPRLEEIPALLKEEVIAYRYECADGLKATMLLLEGLVYDFTLVA